MRDHRPVGWYADLLGSRDEDADGGAGARADRTEPIAARVAMTAPIGIWTIFRLRCEALWSEWEVRDIRL